MDLFGRQSRQAIDSYITSYVEKNGEPEFYYLDRKRISVEWYEQADAITAEDREVVYRGLLDFYRMAGDVNPFNYFSKLDFVLCHRETNDPIWNKDLFFRLISDRCLLFYDRRRYACPNGGLHTVAEHKRNHRLDAESSLLDGERNVAAQKFEPMTSIHMNYYYEYRHNYQMLTEALKKQEWFTEKSGMLLRELNCLGKKCKTSDPSKDVKCRDWSEEISAAVCIYTASVIWRPVKRNI